MVTTHEATALPLRQGSPSEDVFLKEKWKQLGNGLQNILKGACDREQASVLQSVCGQTQARRSAILLLDGQGGWLTYCCWVICPLFHPLDLLTLITRASSDAYLSCCFRFSCSLAHYYIVDHGLWRFVAINWIRKGFKLQSNLGSVWVVWQWQAGWSLWWCSFGHGLLRQNHVLICTALLS